MQARKRGRNKGACNRARRYLIGQVLVSNFLMLEGREFVLFGWPKSMRGLETQFEAMMEALDVIGNLLLVRMAGQFPGKIHPPSEGKLQKQEGGLN